MTSLSDTSSPSRQDPAASREQAVSSSPTAFTSPPRSASTRNDGGATTSLLKQISQVSLSPLSLSTYPLRTPDPGITGQPWVPVSDVGTTETAKVYSPRIPSPTCSTRNLVVERGVKDSTSPWSSPAGTARVVTESSAESRESLYSTSFWGKSLGALEASAMFSNGPLRPSSAQPALRSCKSRDIENSHLCQSHDNHHVSLLTRSVTPPTFKVSSYNATSNQQNGILVIRPRPLTYPQSQTSPNLLYGDISPIKFRQLASQPVIVGSSLIVSSDLARRRRLAVSRAAFASHRFRVLQELQSLDDTDRPLMVVSIRHRDRDLKSALRNAADRQSEAEAHSNKRSVTPCCGRLLKKTVTFARVNKLSTFMPTDPSSAQKSTSSVLLNDDLAFSASTKVTSTFSSSSPVNNPSHSTSPLLSPDTPATLPSSTVEEEQEFPRAKKKKKERSSSSKSSRKYSHEVSAHQKSRSSPLTGDGTVIKKTPKRGNSNSKDLSSRTDYDGVGDTSGVCFESIVQTPSNSQSQKSLQQHDCRTATTSRRTLDALSSPNEKSSKPKRRSSREQDVSSSMHKVGTVTAANNGGCSGSSYHNGTLVQHFGGRQGERAKISAATVQQNKSNDSPQQSIIMGRQRSRAAISHIFDTK